MRSSKGSRTVAWTRRLAADSGAAAVDFLVVAVGASLFTLIALAIVFAGFMRVKATDAVAEAARFAMAADIDGVGAVSISTMVQSKLQASIGAWPVRINLAEVTVQDWALASAKRGIAVTASFSVPGLEWLGASQKVSAHAASELN